MLRFGIMHVHISLGSESNVKATGWLSRCGGGGSVGGSQLATWVRGGRVGGHGHVRVSEQSVV